MCDVQRFATLFITLRIVVDDLEVRSCAVTRYIYLFFRLPRRLAVAVSSSRTALPLSFPPSPRHHSSLLRTLTSMGKRKSARKPGAGKTKMAPLGQLQPFFDSLQARTHSSN